MDIVHQAVSKFKYFGCLKTGFDVLFDADPESSWWEMFIFLTETDSSPLSRKQFGARDRRCAAHNKNHLTCRSLAWRCSSFYILSGSAARASWLAMHTSHAPNLLLKIFRRDVARRESGELSRDGHCPSISLLIYTFAALTYAKNEKKSSMQQQGARAAMS